MNNLKDIHNTPHTYQTCHSVVLSGFQWTIWRIYTTSRRLFSSHSALFYQDFNEQFEGYTQQFIHDWIKSMRCFIRISMNNLKDIHNLRTRQCHIILVVLSGFQWTIWRIYTTHSKSYVCKFLLFYQDFNEQFKEYTIRTIYNVLLMNVP